MSVRPLCAALIAWAACTNAFAQAHNQASPPAPQSRQEWRSIRRACSEEWNGMMKANKSKGLTWADFFEACSKRH